MIITILNRLSEEGTLSRMMRAGLIDCSVIRKKDIYNDCDTRIKMGSTRSTAVHGTALKFRCSIQHVYRTIKQLEVSN